jgi:hypothetical protein
MLFAGSGEATCVDAELGVYMQPKPVTELDRLSWVVQQIVSKVSAPKGLYKIVPSGEMKMNEAFCGLNKTDAFSLDNWQMIGASLGEEL